MGQSEVVSRRRFLRQSFAFSALAGLGALRSLASSKQIGSATGASRLLMVGDWGYEKFEAQSRVAKAMQAYVRGQGFTTEALLMLEPRRDAGLIARTMIDGLYQLLWTTHQPEVRAQRWRTFSIIYDWRLIQGRLKEGIPVEDEIIKQNELALKTFGHIHLLKKPKAGSVDPYHRKWSGTTLSEMANVAGREMYDGPYSELSDWEHWGVAGIGESISRKDGHLTVDSNTWRGTMLALLALFMCVIQTLQVVDLHCSLGLTEKLEQRISTFRTTLDSFQAGEG